MKSLSFIVLLIAASWHFIELESDLVLASMIAPLVFIISLACLAGWLGIRLMPTGNYSGDSSAADISDGGCGD